MKLASLISVFVALGALQLTHAADTKAKRLNVLFLIADDLNCDVGCYGVADVKTPNIDKLAARGVRFDHAYCQVPWCSPSRSSFMTGRRPNVTGVLMNPLPDNPLSPNFREKIPQTVTMPQLFKKNGWYSSRVGKIYHYGVPADIGTSSLDDFPSWEMVINPRGRDREEHNKIFSLVPGQFGTALSWLADDEGDDRDHTDGIGADQAINLLERFKREDRPFFLAVGFYRPHTPFVGPKKYFDLYPTNGISLPTLSADDHTRTPGPAYESGHAEQDSTTDNLRKEAIQGYHAVTTFMDAQMGRVVEALDRLGLADNTIIVFTSDHGYHLGDHGLWQKQSLFERATRVPLIIAVPHTQNKGMVARGFAELLDIYPTLADLCGLKAPSYLEGVTLRPLLEKSDGEVRSHVVSQIHRKSGNDGWAVRSSQWRYIEWGKRLEDSQLFDEMADPAETKNLSIDPKQADTVAALHVILERERAIH
jgi:iduronate 2-sulfatase